MTSLQDSYRTGAIVIRSFLLALLFVCTLLQGQQKTKLSAPSAGTAPPAHVDQAKQDATPTSAISQRQQSVVDSMTNSVVKQRASVQSQIASTVPSNDFFTSSWTTAPAFSLPTIVPACSPMPEDDLKTIVTEAAKAQDLKPELVRAVIRAESNSYPCAVSEKGALGLMQLMPEVAQQFGVDALDPKQNVAAGSQYLKQLMTKYKSNMKLALAAYNAGPQRVDADGKVPDIPETVAYVDAILKDLTPTSTHPGK
ncbi:MAG TPA: lytic transglycosylase domain-containing protein [Bryobacteraceae bacterium]|jgi:soluble lytic murein transglycosylase-like protein|nr:lytic transglycosylase domain-containing protein [Bryobacteraceae bacterium]